MKRIASRWVLLPFLLLIFPVQAAIVESVITDGIWWVKKCKPELMAPGYTFTHPLEGDTLFWFDGCKVVRTMEMPGRVGVMKQRDDGTLYGLVGSSLLGYASDGQRTLRVYKQSMPGGMHHDVVETAAQGTYFVLVKEPIGDGVYDDLVLEVDSTGNVLWSWSVNTNLLGSKMGADALVEKWVHSNSLAIFPNGDILLSARNLNEVVRISYPSGIVMYRIGSNVLGLQHHASVTADGILIYNNGTKDKQTSVVLLDEAGNVLLKQPLGFYSEAFGSVERLSNGNWLVVNGKSGVIYEYTPDFSETVFEARLLRGNYIPYAADKNKPVKRNLYRASRVSRLP